MTDYQLEVDAKILVHTKQTTTGDGHESVTVESLHPDRHKLSLPINAVNILFEDIGVSFNHHTKLECDRNAFLNFDGWGLVSALEQNFNPVPSDIKRKANQGE